MGATGADRGNHADLILRVHQDEPVGLTEFVP